MPYFHIVSVDKDMVLSKMADMEKGSSRPREKTHGQFEKTNTAP